MITNVEIAWVFNEIADLLEIKGENPFKVRAYRQGARVLEQLPESAVTLAATGQLEHIKGIGPALAKKIVELVETGRCSFHERLRAEIPPGLLSMLAIPGLGPKSIRLIYERLGITTLEELEEAARRHRLRELPGMGSKTEWNVLRGIEMLNTSAGKAPLGVAWPLAEGLLQALQAMPEVGEASIAGEIRRGKEMVERICLVAASEEPERVVKSLQNHPYFREVFRTGPNYLRGVGRLGITTLVVVVPPAWYGRALLFYTGSAAHFRQLVELCPSERRGLLLGIGRLVPGEAPEDAEPLPLVDAGTSEEPRSEEEIYAALGLEYIPPELREGEGEVEVARAGRLPRLVTVEDILGDLHVHTNWSDGMDSPEEMAAAAKARGYAYLAVADHSRSLAVARGLSTERLLEQAALVRNLGAKWGGLRLLAGAEVDILPDGSLDFPDEVLAQLDVVVASIHTGFKQDQAKIMERLASALKHPRVHILGHPTGRLLGRRSPYSVDVEQLLEIAFRSGKVLEINSIGDRLDLGAEAARRAAKMGVPLVINTDAHDVAHLRDMRYGIAVARRAWLEPRHIINTRPWEELKGYLGG